MSAVDKITDCESKPEFSQRFKRIFRLSESGMKSNWPAMSQNEKFNPEIPWKNNCSLPGQFRLIIGRNDNISENPMNEMKIAAELVTTDAIKIATATT